MDHLDQNPMGVLFKMPRKSDSAGLGWRLEVCIFKPVSAS